MKTPRKKSTKRNEKFKSKKEINLQTKSVEEKTNNSVPDVAQEFDSKVDDNEKEIIDIMSGFSDEKISEEIETPELATEDEFTPRKKRESKKDREQKERTLKLPGKMIVRTTNRIMVSAICSIDSYISKEPISPEYISMAEEELNDEDLIALAEEAFKSMGVSGNPVLMFFASMGATVVTNYVLMKSLLSKEKREEPKK